MPIYVYRYTTADGETKTVERVFRMSERPDEIRVRDGGQEYLAFHAIQAPGIQGVSNREEHRLNPSDLPPVDYTPPAR